MVTDVTLWFARNKDNNYSTVFEIDEDNKNDEYLCPVCNTRVVPKGIKEESLVSRHFAHLDTSKCNAESLIHWCYKNNFLVTGDQFIIIDRETKQPRKYICKTIEIEVQHSQNGLTYRPDMTITTESGETIFFEINYKNRKKPREYINVWLEFNNIVVEIDVKTLLQLNTKDNYFEFKPIFMNHKCYIKDIERKTIKNCLIQLKEQAYKKKTSVGRDFVNKLDWFWSDLANYKLGKCEIDSLYYSLDYLIDNTDSDDRELLFEIIEKFKCNQALDAYYNYKNNIVKPLLDKLFLELDVASYYKYHIDSYNTDMYVSITEQDGYWNKHFNFNEHSSENIVNEVENYIEENYVKCVEDYINHHWEYIYPDFSNIKLNFSVPYYKQSGYYNLPRYDFVAATHKLNSLKDEINEFINKSISEIDLKEYRNPKSLRKLNKKLKFQSEDLNKKLLNIIYPITYIVDHSDSIDIKIALNYNFTKDDRGKAQRWLIKDFIEALAEFKIKNVENIRED